MRANLSIVILCVIVSQSFGCDYFCCYDSFTEELKQNWKECCTPRECKPFKELEEDSWDHMNYLLRSENLPAPCNFLCCVFPTLGTLHGSNEHKCCNDAQCQFRNSLPAFARLSLSLRPRPRSLAEDERERDSYSNTIPISSSDYHSSDEYERSIEEFHRRTSLAEAERNAARERESYSNTIPESSSNDHPSDESEEYQSDVKERSSHQNLLEPVTPRNFNKGGSQLSGTVVWIIFGLVAFCLALAVCVGMCITNRMNTAAEQSGQAQPGTIVTGAYPTQADHGFNNNAPASIPTMATAPPVEHYQDADLPPSYEEILTTLTGKGQLTAKQDSS